MTDKELLIYCKENYSNNSSFSGNEIVMKLKLTNIVHAQLLRLVNKSELEMFVKDRYRYYFIKKDEK